MSNQGSQLPYGASALSTPPNTRGRLRSWFDPDQDPPDGTWARHFPKEEWRTHVLNCQKLSQTEIRETLQGHYQK